MLRVTWMHSKQTLLPGSGFPDSSDFIPPKANFLIHGSASR